MSDPPTTKAIVSLNKQLRDEKIAHAATRNELQAEIERVWRLVPSIYIDLMREFPSLRKLFHVLGEGLYLQDPSRGAPIQDTARVDYVPDEYRVMSSTERAALVTHTSARSRVEEMTKQLEWLTHKLSKLVPGAEAEYNPPVAECECGCGRLIYQTAKGRDRRFYSATCRKRASRNVTNPEPSESIGSR